MQLTYDDENNQFFFLFEDPLGDGDEIEVSILLNNPFSNFHRAYEIAKQFSDIGAEIISSILQGTDSVSEKSLYEAIITTLNESETFMLFVKDEYDRGEMPDELYETLCDGGNDSIAALKEYQTMNIEELRGLMMVSAIEITEIGCLAYLTLPDIVDPLASIEFMIKSKIPAFDDQMLNESKNSIVH